MPAFSNDPDQSVLCGHGELDKPAQKDSMLQMDPKAEPRFFHNAGTFSYGSPHVFVILRAVLPRNACQRSPQAFRPLDAPPS
jgi:hypothetical protein